MGSHLKALNTHDILTTAATTDSGSNSSTKSVVLIRPAQALMPTSGIAVSLTGEAFLSTFSNAFKQEVPSSSPQGFPLCFQRPMYLSVRFCRRVTLWIMRLCGCFCCWRFALVHFFYSNLNVNGLKRLCACVSTRVNLHFPLKLYNQIVKDIFSKWWNPWLLSRTQIIHYICGTW